METTGETKQERLVIKASLTQAGSGEENPFRILDIPAHYTLYELARSIIEQFGKSFDHSFGFYSNLENWKKSEVAYELFADLEGEDQTGTKGVKNTPVLEVLSGKGDRVLFLFDYGEEWKILLVLQDRREGPGFDGVSMEDAFGAVPGGDQASEVSAYQKGLEEGRHYYELEEEALERVAKIFQMGEGEDPPAVNARTLETYYDYLRNNIRFPFFGVFSEQREQNSVYHPVEVLAIMDPDESEELDKYGLLTEVLIEGQKAKMPLAEIVINQGDPNYDLVEDYCVWYWSERPAG